MQLSGSSEILPIGLSFHTFQSVSYVIDVYYKKIKPEKHLGIYASYVLFFPQMVAGPIERYNTLGSELNKNNKFNLGFIKAGIPLILVGFFYKMVIADNCGEIVNSTFVSPESSNNWNILIAVFLFFFQIYSDFFGYSLIAQGSAALFGIRLMDNFTFPLYSKNIVEFWKNWHISLTSWFRDYVYIPLGGNRVNVLRYSLNIALIFMLSGLWHGAGYNFLIWGILHAMFYLLYVHLFKKYRIVFPTWINCVFTFVLVSFIFVFFRTGKLAESINIFKGIFTENVTAGFKTIPAILLVNIAFIVLLEYFVKQFANYSNFVASLSTNKKLMLFLYLFFAVLTFSGIDNLPFIYFQF